MNLEMGCFYVYNGRPVTVVQQVGEFYEIRHIQQNLKNKIVHPSKLTKLTRILANKIISEYNMRNHAFNECLIYM